MSEKKFNQNLMNTYDMFCPLACPECKDNSLESGMHEHPCGEWYRKSDANKAIMEMQSTITAKDATIDGQEASIKDMHLEIEANKSRIKELHDETWALGSQNEELEIENREIREENKRLKREIDRVISLSAVEFGNQSLCLKCSRSIKK